MPSCPSEEELLELMGGSLAEERRREIQEHLDDCPICPRALAGAAMALTGAPPSLETSASLTVADESSGPTSGASPARLLPPGTRVGRYLVLGAAGRGAMGTVYAAYDPHLGRKVALKLLHHPRSGGRRLEDLELRLLREAQTMAQLTDPNVVSVHDVGRHGDDLFVAMDFVEGVSLRAWIEERPRPWREVVGKLLQAGRGLAAAHRAGIVHRDFKPDNVLLRASDGRVCVTDFGLARTLGTGLTDSDPSLAGESPLVGSLTRSGAIVGTPAYMAPEQLSGNIADARADLFAFCVALYEALYRERPFPGRTLDEIQEAIRTGNIRPPPAGDKVPTWIRRVLVKGLHADPALRPPSMDALLRALSADPGRSLRRGAALVLAVSALGVFALLLHRAAGRAAELCGGGERLLEEVWDSARRERIQAAFLRTRVRYAADAWQKAAPVLEDYARSWVSAHRAACEATHLRGEQSEATLDLRMQCLTRRLRGFSMLLDVLERPDAKTVEKALAAAHALDDVGGCADSQRLAQIPEPSHPETRARVEAVRQRLAHVRALRAAGHTRDALAEAEALGPVARELAYKPALAELLFLVGSAWLALGDGKKAEAVLHDAAVVADASRHDDIAAQAKITLVAAVGDQSRIEEALRWADQADAAIARLGGDPRKEADLLDSKGSAFGRMDRAQEAIACFERALRVFETKLGPNPPKTIELMLGLGLAISKAGRHAEALPWLTRALSTAEAVHGPQHPEVARVCITLGMVLRRLGRLEEALSTLTRALRLQEEHLGPDSLAAALTLTSLGLVAGDLGRPQESLDAQRRALAIRERALGPEHPMLLSSLNNVALELTRLGRPQESLQYSERALRIHERKLGKHNPRLRYSLGARARALEHLHRFEEARVTYQQEVAVIEKTLGPEHPDLGWPLDGIGRTLTAQRRAAEAVGFHTRALAFHEKAHGQKSFVLASTLTDRGRAYMATGQRAEARADLERALALGEGVAALAGDMADAKWLLVGLAWSRGEHARAHALAEGAAAALRKSSRPHPGLQAKIERWLATHRGR
jgi:tetratricopeptide (TPR) repeat protein